MNSGTLSFIVPSDARAISSILLTEPPEEGVTVEAVMAVSTIEVSAAPLVELCSSTVLVVVLTELMSNVPLSVSVAKPARVRDPPAATLDIWSLFNLTEMTPSVSRVISSGLTVAAMFSDEVYSLFPRSIGDMSKVVPLESMVTASGVSENSFTELKVCLTLWLT